MEMYAQRSEHFALRETTDSHSFGTDPSTPSSEMHHLQLSGRISICGSEDAQCTLRWMRGRVARVSAGRVIGSSIGSQAILYLDLIGRVEGVISWVGPAEMDVDITAPHAKWLRLQQQFAILAAMAPADRENLRGHCRITLDAPDTALSLGDGRMTTARVQDVSRSGAAVGSSVLPEIGSIVTLGSTRGRVVRLFDDGFATQFLRLLPLERFGPAYRL